MVTSIAPQALNGIQIRKANAEDAIVLALLARVTFAETFEAYFTDKEGLAEHYEHTFSVRTIRRSLQNPNTVFWVATHNHLPIGYVKVKMHSLPEAALPGRCSQIEKIYVLKDYLSKGVGYQLYAAAAAGLQQQCFDHVWLQVWQENHRAIRFYQKQGFVRINQNWATVGRDRFSFLTMIKQLNGV